MSLPSGPLSDTAARPPFPRISVVMPVRDAAATIGEQLAALATQSYTGWWELVVADNGSVDDSLRIVSEWSDRLPRVRTVDATGRRGPGFARNVGAAGAEGELLLFCDADDVVSGNWIETMCAAAAAADMVGGHLDLDMLNRPLVRLWRSPLTDEGLPVPMGLWAHIITANFGVWRDVYLAVGGCDESFEHAAGEDVDLSWRLKLAGGTIAFAPEAVVHYRLRSDLRATHRQLTAYGMAAALLYRRFRMYGAERPPLAGTIKYWLRLMQRAPRELAVPAHRGSWVVDASYQWGRLRGALRYRVLFW